MGKINYTCDIDVLIPLSFFKPEMIIKSTYPVGTIRIWNGKKYIKTATGRWNQLNENKSTVSHDGEFVLTSKGSKDFGEITPEMSKIMHRQSGKIRLRIGIESETDKNHNYGEKHINRALRAKNLADIGFNNARDFVEYISENISYIFENGKSLIAVREKNSHLAGAWMELTPSVEGDFYDVKTASPLRSNWYKNKTPVWINPKLGVLTKSIGVPPAHQFNKNIESIYGIVSNSNGIILQSDDLSSKKIINKSFRKQIEEILCSIGA